jgi:hypothetical protein
MAGIIDGGYPGAPSTVLEGGTPGSRLPTGSARLGVTYTGTDGSWWDLRHIALDGASVFLTNQGLTGLRAAEYDVYARQSATAPGQVLTGMRARERKVYLPLLIGVNLDPLTFLALSDRWAAANAIGEYGVLRVTRPDGEWREISIRFNDDGGGALNDDPIEEGSELVGWTYYADNPYWYGPPVDITFQPGAPRNFFNVEGGGATPFYISPSFTFATATVANPGDVDAWATYTFHGPIDYWSVGLGDGFLGSLPVPAGYRLEVFTDPSQQYALLTNEATGDMVDVTPQIGSIDWRPVPRASAEPLRLTIQGAGTLDVELRPRFNRGY